MGSLSAFSVMYGRVPGSWGALTLRHVWAENSGAEPYAREVTQAKKQKEKRKTGES